MKCGDPNTSSFGSVISLDHRAKIEGYIELAKKSGGTILVGGGRPADLPSPWCDGAFVEPTIISGLPPTHACSVEEIFGPVITVHPFRTEDEALAIANNTTYGLAGSIWTTNLNRAHKIAKDWQTGMVWIK